MKLEFRTIQQTLFVYRDGVAVGDVFRNPGGYDTFHFAPLYLRRFNASELRQIADKLEELDNGKEKPTD